MGCGASTGAPVVADEEKRLDGRLPTASVTADAELPDVMKREMVDDALADMLEAEREAVSYKPDAETFVGSALIARAKAKDDAVVMEDACVRLQAHNRRMKNTIAKLDAETVHEALLEGGFLGQGVNDNKIIAALCTRTKAQLGRTAKKFRELYDLDLRATIKQDTSGWFSTGSYASMMFYALAPADDYIADMIDRACSPTLGCDYELLVELFCTRSNAEMREGKRAWEGRTDRSLIDYLNSEMSGMIFGNKSLRKLLLKLLKGERDEGDDVDEAKAKEQVDEVHALCSQSTWFGEDSDAIARLIELIGSNNRAQNARLGDVYERTHDHSMGSDLHKKVNDEVYLAFVSLTMPPSRFIAARVHAALQKWSTDKGALVELLGGLDGHAMHEVHVSYADKYSMPLISALRSELSAGHFLQAVLVWAEALADPAGGLEGVTEVDISAIVGDADALGKMVDALLVENASLNMAVTRLDVERIAEACGGWSVDDTALIKALTTRSKRFLTRVSMLYRETRGLSLERLIDKEITGTGSQGWYAYLAKLLVLPEEQSDARILSLAMDGLGSDKHALIEFLCARHPRRVRAAKRKWEGQQDASLVDRLSDELDGDFETICLTLLKGKREHDYDDYVEDDDSSDEFTAKKMAEKIHAHLAQKAKRPVILLLCNNSASLNGAINRAYEDAYDESLGRSLDHGGFDGVALDALKALLQGPYHFYAAKLKEALKAKGEEKPICRILGSHDKWEVQKIAAAYDEKYATRLKDALDKGCKGDYKRLAVAWVDLTDHLEQPKKRVQLPEHLLPPKTAAESAADEAAATPPGELPQSKGLGVRSTFWRVTNAQPLSDHWSIGELDLLLDGGVSAKRDIKRVVCSYNHNNNDLSVVHDGEWYTGGGAEPHSWGGAHTFEGRGIGGSWLGFEFHSLHAISGVTIAQGEVGFPGTQGVAEAWLEALVDGNWQPVATLHFDAPSSQATVTAAPAAPPSKPAASAGASLPVAQMSALPVAQPAMPMAQPAMPMAQPAMPMAQPAMYPGQMPQPVMYPGQMPQPPVVYSGQPAMPMGQPMAYGQPPNPYGAQPMTYAQPAPMMQAPVVMQPMMMQPQVQMMQPQVMMQPATVYR